MIIHRLKIPIGTIIQNAIKLLLSKDNKHDFTLDDIKLDKVSNIIIVDLAECAIKEKDCTN